MTNDLPDETHLRSLLPQNVASKYFAAYHRLTECRDALKRKVRGIQRLPPGLVRTARLLHQKFSNAVFFLSIHSITIGNEEYNFIIEMYLTEEGGLQEYEGSLNAELALPDSFTPMPDSYYFDEQDDYTRDNLPLISGCLIVETGWRLMVYLASLASESGKIASHIADVSMQLSLIQTATLALNLSRMKQLAVKDNLRRQPRKLGTSMEAAERIILHVALDLLRNWGSYHWDTPTRQGQLHLSKLARNVRIKLIEKGHPSLTEDAIARYLKALVAEGLIQ